MLLIVTEMSDWSAFNVTYSVVFNHLSYCMPQHRTAWRCCISSDVLIFWREVINHSEQIQCAINLKKIKEIKRKRKEEERKKKKLFFSKMKRSNREPTGARQGLYLWVLALHSNAHNCFSKLDSHTAGSCSSLIFSNLCSE